MATQDWETTCLIYGEESTSTETNEDGRLSRGSIELTVSTVGPVYCRRIAHDDDHKFRFWMLNQELVFRLTLACDTEEDAYQRVEIALQSCYPASFPKKSKHAWLQWMQAQAISILKQQELSYSVCTFVQDRALDFFATLYQDQERHLILFSDTDTSYHCYPDSTIVATLGQERQEAAASQHLYLQDEARDLVYERHDANGDISLELSPIEAKHIWPLVVLWKDWLPVHCKICLDTVPATDSAEITCGHAFCRDCLVTYLSHKAHEVQTFKTNPFVCPTCGRGMLIVACVKQFISPELMDEVREWHKDLKNPPCYALPRCLKRKCQGVMRRVAIDEDIVYCDKCNGRWCEMCLQRAPEDEEHIQCNIGGCVEFCKRYLAANEKSQERCEQKFPWIKLYAKSRMDDDAVAEWVQTNGQVCPGCKTGIERSEGCFHIKCHCGTHFCYLCGEEIFAPFYGTHHCWERSGETWLPST